MIKNKKNKKAFELLGNHTVNIIVSILCILVLIYIGAKIYFYEETDLKKAESSVNEIITKMNELKENEIGKAMVVSPNNWFVMFFDSEHDMPTTCLGKDCVCICDAKAEMFSNINGKLSDRILSCQKNGYCKDIQYKIMFEGDPMSRDIPVKVDGTYKEIMLKVYYKKINKLLEFNFMKKDNKIVILANDSNPNLKINDPTKNPPPLELGNS